MRVTNNMIFGATTRNARMHLDKLYDIQNQMATGKKISRPSDDPTAADRAMLLRGTLQQQEQYGENIRDASTWLNVTDGALAEAAKVLGEVRVLAVQASSDTLDKDERLAIVETVGQLKKQLQVIANSEVNGRYMFGGTMTVAQQNKGFTLPYPDATPEIVYEGNGGLMEVEVVPGVTLPFNSPGSVVFGKSTDFNRAFKVLDDLELALKTPGSVAKVDINGVPVLDGLGNPVMNNQAEQISDQLARLDIAVQRINTERAVIGSRTNRVDLLESRYEDAKISYKERLSETEEAEFTEVVAAVMQQEAIYQASLAASARIIQPSLLEYLR
jgi:flagellar hook-associated protein 3 FlgL